MRVRDERRRSCTAYWPSAPRVLGPEIARGQAMLARPSPLVRTVIGCAIEVHRTLGLGLLESAYEACLVHEFLEKGIEFKRQLPVAMVYKGTPVDCGYRADLVVENEVLLEIKSVDYLLPVHTAQVLTYLKLIDLTHGIILNFNVTRLLDGIKNVLR